MLDILRRRDALSAGDYAEARTKLRQANFSLMPVTCDELINIVNATSVKDGTLVVTAELRALKEGILALKMWGTLQSPKELAWLSNTLESSVLALQQLWSDGFDEATVYAQSDWLLELADVKGWTHCLQEDKQSMLKRYRISMVLLTLLPKGKSLHIRNAYWDWLDSRVLHQLKTEDPESYTFVLSHLKLSLIHI